MRTRKIGTRRLVWLGAVGLAAAVLACSLEDGGVAITSDEDGGGARVDGATGRDGDAPEDDGGQGSSDAASDASLTDDGGGRHFVFANTATDVYVFDTDSHVLKKVGSPVGCGIPAGFDTFDLARPSDGGLDVLTWKRTGSFSFYALQGDGGCIDLHGGPGSNPAGNAMWVGFQLATTDTLLSVVAQQTSVYSYDSNGNFIFVAPDVLPLGGASADIACDADACFTALPHDRCPSDAGASDCLYTFAKDGSAKSQVGTFEKTGVVGIAYDRGSVFGFCSDGSVVQIGTTAPSVGKVISVLGTSTTGLVWAGAASASDAP